ncbi:MAG TPA: PH domain-containing protein [Nocardioidaceae bacterium]|nr:PH domain-containing protein [Nocardioidaceae bacterium]
MPGGPPLRRLHPLTPLFRSWRLVGVLVAVAVSGFRDNLDRLRWFWDALHGDAQLGVVAKFAAVALAVAVLAVVGSWLSWRVTGFAIVSDPGGRATLLFHRGLFVRRRSQVRLDRVQSVDVNQPLVARLCGLAVVRLDMAAGASASIDLAYLAVREAWALRAEILAHGGEAPTTAPGSPMDAAATATPPGAGPGSAAQGAAVPSSAVQVPTAPLAAAVGPDQGARLVARVSLGRLAVAALLDGVVWWLMSIGYFVLVAVLTAAFGPSVVVAGAAGFVPLALSFLAYLRRRVMAVLREANFELWRTPSGLRISAGLTSITHRSVDLERVQGLRLEEPFWWRRLGWARVTVDVAGDTHHEQHRESSHHNALMPVVDRAGALRLIWDVAQADVEHAAVAPPGRASRLVDPWGYRFLGAALLPGGALTRHGRLRRETTYIPYARIQSARVTQGPIQRVLGLATVHLDLPTGGHRWSAPHRELADATHLVEEASARARRQRLRVARPASTGGPDPDAQEGRHRAG